MYDGYLLACLVSTTLLLFAHRPGIGRCLDCQLIRFAELSLGESNEHLALAFNGFVEEHFVRSIHCTEDELSLVHIQTTKSHSYILPLIRCVLFCAATSWLQNGLNGNYLFELEAHARKP